jgi:hypothetical protein
MPTHCIVDLFTDCHRMHRPMVRSTHRHHERVTVCTYVVSDKLDEIAANLIVHTSTPGASIIGVAFAFFEI